MSRKTVSAIMMFLLVLGTLVLAFNVQPVKSDYVWTETIYIRADGSIQPSTAPISSVDNVTYMLTDNIAGNVPDGSSVIIIQRDNIIIDGAGHTLQGAQASGSKGIELVGRSNVTIKNMKITAFSWGIYLVSSSNNSVSGNNITANSWGGIYLEFSSNNSVSGNSFANDGLSVLDSYGNVVTGNFVNGKPLVYLEDVSDYTVGDAGQVILVECNNVTVENLNLSNNTTIGIELLGTNNSTISGNNLTSVGDGILLFSSSDNSVSGNNITNNWNGILLLSSSDNSVSGNNITNNSNGIYVYYSSNNSVSGNNITASSECGIISCSSSNNSVSGNNITNNWVGIELMERAPKSSFNNTIYHNNFINNTYQVFSSGLTNVWDDGYPSGGNYWSDYVDVDVKSGPGQDSAGSDGVGDTQYVIYPNNRDRYPLTYPYGTFPPPTYALTITTTVGGTTDPAPRTYSYTANSTVRATAIPNAQFLFGHWELDGSNVGSAIFYTVSMDCNHTLTAVFVLGLAVSVSPDSASVHLLQSVTFTSITVGGASPYSYQWYLNDSPVSGATSNNWTFALEPSGNYSTGTYSVHLNVTDSMGNTANSNQASVTVSSLFGDLNNDSKVDTKDVSVVARAFGSSPNGPRWNIQADVNQDGKVDIKDIALVAKHFGQHYP